MQLIAAIRAVTEKGEHKGPHPLYKKRKDRITAFHYFVGDVDLAGEDAAGRVSVDVDQHGPLFVNLVRNPEELLKKRTARSEPGFEARGSEPSPEDESSYGERLGEEPNDRNQARESGTERVTDTKVLRGWFGNSEVLDESGVPTHGLSIELITQVPQLLAKDGLLRAIVQKQSPAWLTIRGLPLPKMGPAARGFKTKIATEVNAVQTCSKRPA